METRFTKGEWTSDNNSVMIPVHNHQAGREHLSLLLFKTEGENIANAKLIAAAPDLFNALEIALGEVRDWHEYNFNQIDSFDNNGVNNERDMQIDIANSIHHKLQIIKKALQKATNNE